MGDALSWLTGTAMTKDVNSIKKRVNQLIVTQHNQQETLVLPNKSMCKITCFVWPYQTYQVGKVCIWYHFLNDILSLYFVFVLCIDL